MKVKKAPIIKTERLCLQAIAQQDENSVKALLTHPQVYQTYMVPDFQSPEEVHKLFDAFKRLSQTETRFVYGIYLQEHLIGFINEVEDDGSEMELGFVIHPDQKNNGFATEVLTACIRELFDLGYRVVKTGAFEENTASIRVMEKSGMVRLAQTEDIDYRGKLHHCIFFEKRND